MCTTPGRRRRRTQHCSKLALSVSTTFCISNISLLDTLAQTSLKNGCGNLFGLLGGALRRSHGLNDRPDQRRWQQFWPQCSGLRMPSRTKRHQLLSTTAFTAERRARTGLRDTIGASVAIRPACITPKHRTAKAQVMPRTMRLLTPSVFSVHTRPLESRSFRTLLAYEVITPGVSSANTAV